MSTGTESSQLKKRGGQSRRPYFRNSHSREMNHYTQRYTHENAAYNVNNPDLNFVSELRSSSAPTGKQEHGQSFKSPQHNSLNHLNSRNFVRGNNSFFNRDPSQTTSSMPNASQRGEIVGGRYVRKHRNQTQNNSRDYHPLPLESNVISNSNFAKNCNFSRSYGSNYSLQNNIDDCAKKNDSQDEKSTHDFKKSAANNNATYHSKSFNYPSSYSMHKYKNRSSMEQERLNVKESYMRKSSPDLSKCTQESLATQRELLISRLNKGECECLVCCELIRVRDQVWHCLSCYHVFHLRCIRKWARSPASSVENGNWRCPACQTLNSEIPFNYYCFCGKSKNPDVNYHLTPHSCGEICNRVSPECSHHCKELCHPGPCPPCVVVIQKTCPCGKSVQTLPCNQAIETSCQSICDKLLNCGVHRCKSLCHIGTCIPCKEVIVQKCFCSKCEQQVACTKDTASCFVYSCGDVCKKDLNCGNHACELVCHPGACQPCQLSVESVVSCCCGKQSVTELQKDQQRFSCLDPVPVCGSMCEKKLHCGPKDNPHCCQSPCHPSECPPCLLTTSIKCRCGAFTKVFPCAQLDKSFVYTCEKRCNRRKDCGRHKCLNNCCVNLEHKCELLCNKKLTCGLHLCQETCHGGNCPTCWNVSFNELRCHCGESVLYPPVACGTKPPECDKPCTRSHPCDHDVKHSCHSDVNCPPCTSLTTKWCYGSHKQCGPVMCFLDGVSCGMPCQKPLPCGRHKCKLTCHPGECLKEAEKCTQACFTPRPSCGHPCNSPCHDGLCPETPCKFQVTSSCPCSHRSETTTCHDSSKSYRLMSSTLLATKMQEIKEGQSVNLSDVLGKKSKNNRLQCNEECALIERNKRLAIALQIQNPDLSSSPGPPSYSEFLKDEAKKSPEFVSDVYDKLSNLVQLAKQSKQKCRSHSFPSMNRDQRRIVHELAEFFGCETQSYDEEPKRNVVATAYKSRCWLPFSNIMSVVQRDMGIRKGPAPIISQKSATVTSQKNKIDYFDYNE